MTPAAEDELHAAVGAYALGVLDDADAGRFEEHLAGCERCAAELDELMGLTPVLAEFVASDGGGPAPYAAAFVAGPRPELLDRLLGEVTARRRTRRTRRRCLAAVAAALIVGGPFAGAALTSGGSAEHIAVSPAEEMYRQGERIGAVDPVTKVDASVSLEDKPWGTQVALKLGNVKGPRRCALVAIGKHGERETVTTWSVPGWGYGVPGAGGSQWNRGPLYTHGGAALKRDEIARFEVRTLDGEWLAGVKV
jgi:hypothetical protein